MGYVLLFGAVCTGVHNLPDSFYNNNNNNNNNNDILASGSPFHQKVLFGAALHIL